VSSDSIGLRARLRQHLAIAWQFLRVGVVRKSQFRTEFLSQVLMDCCWYASKILVFEFLYQHTETIAGWDLQEVRVFLGYLFVADAFMMTWLGQSWFFGRDLKDGKLDPVRVRPASPIFLYFFQRFSLEGAFNMAIALAYLAWGLTQSGVPFGLVGLGQVLWGIGMAWYGRCLLTVGFSIAELHFLHSDLSRFLTEALMAPSDKPLDIFGRRLRQLLLLALPLGVLAYAPACLVLGRVSPLMFLAYTGWLAAMGAFVAWAWRASFRRYESALS